MKKRILYHSMICLLAVSCTVQEMDNQPLPTVPEDVFFASLESQSAPDTKVYVNEDIELRWNAEDQLSIFDKNTLNRSRASRNPMERVRTWISSTPSIPIRNPRRSATRAS